MPATRCLLTGLLLASVLAAGGCQTANLGAVAPQAAAPANAEAQPGASDAASAPTETVDATPARGPAQTGTFPNLNVIPEPEAPQITQAERNAKVAELNAARQRQSVKSGGGSTPNNVARLRRLSQSHGSEALEEIGGE